MKCRKCLSVLLALLMVLALLPANAFAENGTVDVKIWPSGQTFSIVAEAGDSVENVRVKVQDKTGIPPERQVLYYHNARLEDGNLLADYGYNYDDYLILYELVTVTYKVVGGIWADGTTEDKTETVANGASPANVPTGMSAFSGYTGGAWDTDPSSATITGDTTFTYTFYSPIDDIPAANGGYVYVNGIKWRVIGVSGERYLLISADVLGGKKNWSDAKSYCTTVYNGFSEAEQAAVVPTTKTDSAYHYYNSQYDYSVDYRSSTLTNATLFLLSAEEAETYFSSDADRQPGWWWLRSLRDSYDIRAGVVHGVGALSIDDVDDVGYFGARPAFQLNRGSVLFESAASGGKPSSAAAGGGDFGVFLPPSATDTRKLTLIDSSRSGFIASVSGTRVTPGGSLTVTYGGVTSGDSLTAILLDSSAMFIRYYRAFDADASGSGTLTMTLPSDLTVGTVYFLKLFSEQRNGDTLTDYASAPSRVMLIVSDTEATPKFKTHSLVLSGKIGVNFFMDLPAIDGVDYADSYMTFGISGAGEVSSDPVPFDPTQTNASGVLYGFTCYVAPIQMADTITATFHYGDGLTVSEEYSIAQYIEAFDGISNQFDDETVALVHALADYGHYLQLYLEGVKNWTLGSGDDQYAPMDAVYTTEYDLEAVAEAVADYEIVRSNESADIRELMFSVRLDSDTAILVFFKPVKNYDGSFTVTLDGEPCTATKQSGGYIVEIPDIGAHLLGTTYTIVATTDNGSATVEVSALSYVNSMLTAYAGNTTAENAACAIYAYCVAASAYNTQN